MVIASEAAEGYSAVLFIEEGQVARQMRWSEFGAFLDGYVGLSDLAETDVRAVLVNLNTDLTVSALVFFRIWFDEEGRADSSWNLPIEALAEKGAKGPNLGGGPIRLVCRSQCPDPAFADELWDPDMTPGSNHFQVIRKAVDANALRFRKAETVSDDDIPVLTATEEPSGNSGDSDRSRIAQLLREQRLRIKTLQSVHRDSMADLNREHRLELQGLRADIAQIEQQCERLKVANEQLKRMLSQRNEQYLAMQEEIASGDFAGQDNGEGARASAETVLLQEQLERKQRELELRDDKLVVLERENHELRHRQPPEESLLEELRKQTVFLVAYHPGVGHINLPYDDIETYFNHPLAYAAERCGLNEPAYKEWLAHYEHPVCTHTDASGNPCNEPIMRVTQPAEFESGVSDRCEKHAG